MPKGFAAIEQAQERIQKATESNYTKALYLKLPNDGDTATVRFLEQGEDVYYYYYHDFSHIDKQNGWKVKVPCLDQDADGSTQCPGCREQLPRKFQGLINIIWRNAPVLKKDSDGNYVRDNNKNIVIDGYKDQIAVLRQGINLFGKTLKRKDATYKGLSTRDFEITREGTGFNDTSYSVEPADPDSGAQPMSEEDKVIAEGKYNLEELAGFVDEETFEKIIAKHSNDYNESSEEEGDVTEFLTAKPYGD